MEDGIKVQYFIVCLKNKKILDIGGKLNGERVEWVFHLGPMTAWLSSLGCRLKSPMMLSKTNKKPGLIYGQHTEKSIQ